MLSIEELEREPAALVRDEPVVKAYAPCTAELAECTCPDFCERDHTNE
jgi:hypothetical protein